jgi:hypothetical protein
VGRVVEFSDNPECGWWSGRLIEIFTATTKKFKGEFKSKRGKGFIPYEYIRTTPETHAHPTINIGGVGLPRPEVEAPAEGTIYWFRSIENQKRCSTWSGVSLDFNRLEAGVVHLTESRAQAWADWWRDYVMAAIKK